MNQQAVHPQPTPQGNQQQPQTQLQPQPQQQRQPRIHPMFREGAQFFQRLQQNHKREYDQFQRLNSVQMLVTMGSLQFWSMLSGPRNDEERDECTLYLRNLKDIRKREVERSNTIFGFLIDIKRWFRPLKHSEPPSQTKSTSQKNNTATQQSKWPSLQSQDALHRVSDWQQKSGDLEQDETKPLKSE